MKKYFIPYLIVALFLGALGATTYTTLVNGDFCLGIQCETNLVINPMAQYNKNDIITQDATIAVDNSTPDLDNAAKGSFKCSVTAANGYCGWTTKTPRGALKDGMCWARFRYKSDAPIFYKPVSGTFGWEQTFEATSVFTDAVVRAPCASTAFSAALGRATVGDIFVAKVEYGKATGNIFSVPTQEYTAYVNSNGTFTSVTPVGSNWISTIGVTDTSRYRITYGGAVAGKVMNCGADMAIIPSPASSMSTMVSTTNAGFVDVRTIYANANQAWPFVVKCIPTDTPPMAIAVSNLAFDWRDYSGTITSGSGSLANFVVEYLKYRRSSDGKLHLKGKIKFTGTSGTWANPRIPLPTGILIPSAALTSRRIDGIAAVDYGVREYILSGFYGNGFNSYVEIGSGYGNNNNSIPTTSITNASPFAFAVDDYIVWEIGPFDVTEGGSAWQPSQGAMIGPGLVLTAQKNDSLRETVITFYGANTSTACSSGTCSSYSPTGDATARWSAVGQYFIDFNPPFRSAPVCICNPATPVGNSVQCVQNFSTATGASTSVVNYNTGNGTNANGLCSCSCKGVW